MSFSEDSRFRPYAEVRENKHFICFPAGVYLILLSLFSRMLSDPNVLTHIGNPKLEKSKGSHLWEVPERILDYKDIIKARQKAGADDPEMIGLPECWIRMSYVAEVTARAFEYLIFHELAHLRHGHVLFKKSVYGMNFLADGVDTFNMNWTSEDGWTPMVNQALEYDADCYGAAWSLRLSIVHFKMRQNECKKSKQPTAPRPVAVFPWDTEAQQAEKINSFIENGHEYEQAKSRAANDAMQVNFYTTRNAIQIWGFAVATTFRLMGFDSFDEDRLNEKGYPPIVVRLRCGSLIGLLQLERMGLLKTNQNDIQVGFDAADKAFDCVTGQKHSIMANYILTLNSQQIHNHFGDLEHKWIEMVEHLRPFTWWPLTSDPLDEPDGVGKLAPKDKGLTPKRDPQRKKSERAPVRSRRQ